MYLHLQLGVVFVTLFQIVITEKCLTPNNEEAECVPISSCEILINAVFKAEQSDIIEFVRKSKCEGREADRMVCCGSTSRFLAPMINKNSDKDKLIPDRRYCGYQHSDDYFRNETAIGINEFPWVAGLLYNYGIGRLEIRCSGSLISNRYVLTAALCIREGVPLVEVRLGEHNIYTGEDCTEDSRFYECSDPPQTFAIEKRIVHPEYNNNDYNIGLLRLSKKVQYSDYIRPICLPTAGTMFAKPGDIMLTSGWGIKNNSSAITETKKKIYGKLITNEECGAVYKFVNESNFCIKELENNTDSTCLGDIGGPVIFSFRNQWHQEGIFLSGMGCYPHPVFFIPGLYTKVVNYLDWIKENIEP